LRASRSFSKTAKIQVISAHFFTFLQPAYHSVAGLMPLDLGIIILVLNRISWWMSAKKCSCKPCGLNGSLNVRLQPERKLYRYLKSSLITTSERTCRDKEREHYINSLSADKSQQNSHNGNHIPW